MTNFIFVMHTYQISSRITPFFLRFRDRSTEKQFHTENYRNNIWALQWVCIVGVIIHGLYVIKDFFWATAFGSNLRVLSIILFCLIFISIQIIRGKPKVRTLSVLSAFVLASAILPQYQIILINPSVYTQFTHSIPLIIYGVIFFLSFDFKTLVLFIGPLILTVSFFILWGFLEYEYTDTINVTIVVISNYIVALFGKYFLELNIRKSFLRRLILDQQNDHIRSINNDLQLQKDLYKSLADNTDDLITVRKRDCSLEFVSKSAFDLLGYDESEMLGKKFYHFIHKDDREMVKEQMLNFLPANDNWVLEFRMLKKSGEEIWVHSMGRPVFDSEGSLIAIQNSTRNIDQKKKDELSLIKNNQELEKLNDQKDMFFSIISHDLRGPMHQIISLSTLQNTYINEQNIGLIREMNKHILSSSTYGSDLLDNLLSWTRSQLEGFKLNLVTYNLRNVVETVLGFIKIAAMQKGVIIKIDIPESINIKIDSNTFQSAIRNILSNAIKFTMQGKEIQINVEQNSGQTKLIIQDQGVGIPKENLSRLFDLSQKLSTPGTNKEAGSGLGLVLVKDFLEMNNCSLNIDSELYVGTKVGVNLSNCIVA